MAEIKIGLSRDDGKTWTEIYKIAADMQTPPPPAKREIIVTPQNYKTVLTNIGNVDFSGSNSEYVQVNRDHNMLAIPCTFENLEAEAEVFIVQSNEERLIQIQARGGRHSDSDMCAGCAYKGSFENTRSTNRKELFHRSSSKPGGNGYCGDKAADAKTYPSIKGKWVKLAFRVTNGPSGDKRVTMINKVDGAPVLTTIDAGGWLWDGGNLPACPAREFGNTGNRKPNEILNKAGVWVIFRSDGDTVWRFKTLKVIEV